MIYRRMILIPTLLFQLSISIPMTAGADSRCDDAKRMADTIPVQADGDSTRQIEDQILNACPDGAAGYLVQGLRAERRGRHDEAIRNYREALRLESAFLRAQGNLGLALLEKGSHDDAVVELTRAISSDPDPHYHHGLARIFSQRKIYSLALYHYAEAAKGLSSAPAIPTELAALYREMGKGSDAEKQYRKALGLSPSHEGARLGLASLYMAEGRADRAIEELKQ
ncbi:tetratricopeptide repeat protein, partial [bacterium]|nr:tetratricopeptide repeat protein [bacterium]